MHEKKIKGDIGLAFSIAVLTEQLWNVNLPLSESTKYDLIAEKRSV